MKLNKHKALVVSLTTMILTIIVSISGIVGYYMAVNGITNRNVLCYNFDQTLSAVKGVKISCNTTEISNHIKVKDLEFSDAKIKDTIGGLGHPIDIISDKSISDAYITFEYDPYKINVDDVNRLAIATYDNRNNRMTLLDDCYVDVKNNRVTAYTPHFSQYILVDTAAWYDIWLQSQYIIRQTQQGMGYKIYISYDRSGSMAGQKLNLCKESICNFVDSVTPLDVVDIYAFDDMSSHIATLDQRENNDGTVKLLGYDLESVKDKVNSVSDGGGTAIDANIKDILANEELYSLNEQNMNSMFLAKFIILLTDGQSSFDESLISKCNSLNISIMTVGVGEDVSEEELIKIAALTGGKYIYAKEPSDLIIAFNDFLGSLLGVEPDTSSDSDGDGIPDIIELSGMRNQYGELIITDPESYDTDGDSISDRLEMGEIFEDDNVSEEDMENGLTKYVYFIMQSDPRVFDGNAKVIPPSLDVEILTTTDSVYDMLSTIKIIHPTVLYLNDYKYIKKSQSYVQAALENINIMIEYPSCMGGAIITTTRKTLNCGETYVVGTDCLTHNIEGERDITWVYDKKVKIKSYTSFDGCECDCKHEIKVTVSADNHKEIVRTANFSISDKKEYTVNGDLSIEDEMVIGENCTVNVFGNVNVKGKGILKMNLGSILKVHGNFSFDSNTNHFDYLKAGTIEVYNGDINLKRNYYSSYEHCLAVYDVLRMNHKITVKNSSVSNLYIDGATLDLRFDIKKDGVISNISFSRNRLASEVQYYDDMAKEILNKYLISVETLGLESTEKMRPFDLTLLNSSKSNNLNDIESTIQTALMEWYYKYNKRGDKIDSYKKLFSMMAEFTPDIINGVNITPIGGLSYIDYAVCGYVDYKGYSYSFTPNEYGMQQAISSFSTKVNAFAYSEIKKQVNTAAKETGNYIGGGIVGKYFEAYSNFCFTLNDKDIKGFLRDVGFNKKEAAELAKQIPKVGKYIEYFEKCKNLYNNTKKVSYGLQHFGDVCSTYNMMDAVEAIFDIQRVFLK